MFQVTPKDRRKWNHIAFRHVTDLTATQVTLWTLENKCPGECLRSLYIIETVTSEHIIVITKQLYSVSHQYQASEHQVTGTCSPLSPFLPTQWINSKQLHSYYDLQDWCSFLISLSCPNVRENTHQNSLWKLCASHLFSWIWSKVKIVWKNFVRSSSCDRKPCLS